MVAVADRLRIGPETNVYVGIGRACTCERTTITIIDDRRCVLESASAVYLFNSPLYVIFWFAIRKTRAKRKFQRALRSKKEETRQTVMKRVTTNGVLSSGSFK